MKILFFLILLSLTAWSQTPQLSQPGGEESWLQFLDNRRLTVDEGNGFWLWDVGQRRLVAHPQGLKRILQLTASPDHRYLIASDYPSCARVYRFSDCRPLYAYQPQNPNPDGSYEIQFSSDGSSMLLLGASHGASNPDPRVRQVDLASGREIRSFDFGHKRANRNSILCGPRMRMARAAGTRLQLWDLKSGRQMAQSTLPENFPRLSPDAEGFVCDTGQHKALYAWDDLHKIRDLDPDLSNEQPRASPDGKLHWSKDEQFFKVTRDSDQKVIYQGPASHMLENWLSLGFQIYPNQPSNRVDPVYDFDGRKIGTLPRVMLGYPDHGLISDQPGYGGPLTLYDYRKIKPVGHLSFATPPAYSPNGKVMAVLTRKGVLLIDISATLAVGRIVPCP
ncbi:hypothetical protein JST97_08965 [bacterium]|nr:hypothetical protein [bacterium]